MTATDRRLRSLDLLRGIAVAGMVLVNGEGNRGPSHPGSATPPGTV